VEIESEIAQHLVNESTLNILIIHLLNHFPDHLRQFANFENVSFELPEKAMMDSQQVYWQSNCHEATFEILGMNAWKVVFLYLELNANTAKQHRKDDMPLTKVPI